MIYFGAVSDLNKYKPIQHCRQFVITKIEWPSCRPLPKFCQLTCILCWNFYGSLGNHLTWSWRMLRSFEGVLIFMQSWQCHRVMEMIRFCSYDSDTISLIPVPPRRKVQAHTVTHLLAQLLRPASKSVFEQKLQKISLELVLASRKASGGWFTGWTGQKTTEKEWQWQYFAMLCTNQWGALHSVELFYAGGGRRPACPCAWLPIYFAPNCSTSALHCLLPNLFQSNASYLTLLQQTELSDIDWNAPGCHTIHFASHIMAKHWTTLRPLISRSF